MPRENVEGEEEKRNKKKTKIPFSFLDYTHSN